MQFLMLSIQFNYSVISYSSWPHGLQHDRLPCPSPSSGACSTSCPLNRWCHPTISSSVIPFSSCLQSFPASGIFPVSQLFVSGSQSIGASASVLNEYLGLISFRINWFDLLAVKGTLKNLLQHQSSKSINSLALSFLYGLNLTSIHSVRFSSIQSLSHVWLFATPWHYYWKNHSFD